MDGTVPADVARDKQSQLARQLANLEKELETLQRTSVDTESTLSGVIGLLSDVSNTYDALELGLRRTYNQAWFSRIYIDTPERPRAELECEGDRSGFADALEACRLMAVETLPQRETGPEGPVVYDLPRGGDFVPFSNFDILVELRGFEPLTSSMPWKRATNCAIAPCGCGPRAGD